MKRFEDLKAWQLGRKYRREIYHISEGFPVEEKFQLIAQIRDAACSITANIAEGYERNSNKNFIQFLYISKGSLNKLMTLLEIGKNVEYIYDDLFKELDLELNCNNIGGMLTNLIKARKNR